MPASLGPAFSQGAIWNQIDHELVRSKISLISNEMQRKVVSEERRVRSEAQKTGNREATDTKLLEMHKELTDEWVSRTYDAYCEAWTAQGKEKTAAFIRVVFQNALAPLISVRQGSILSDFDLSAQRTREPNNATANGELVRTLQRLQGSWKDKLEIEARQYEHAQQAEDKEPPTIRRVSKAPPPLPEVSGGGSWHPTSKPTRAPQYFPPHYPNHLKTQTELTICEAVREFPVQTRTLELCKHVICELTPTFNAAVQSNALRSDLALSYMGDLLQGLLLSNCDYSPERCQLEEEIRKSDEWIGFVKEMAAAAQSGSVSNNEAATIHLKERAARPMASVAKHWPDEVSGPPAAGPTTFTPEVTPKTVENGEPPFTHSADYRSIRFNGQTHTLTTNQATIIRILHEAFQRGTPSVGKAMLLGAVEAETSRVRDSFKGSPLWGTLVVKGGRRGTYRLGASSPDRATPSKRLYSREIPR
jgi:hypothetical protein